MARQLWVKICGLKQSLGSRQGSALLWAMLIMMIMIMLLIAAFTFAGDFTSSSISNNQERQAQITARLALENVADAIGNEESHTGKSIIEALQNSQKKAAKKDPDVSKYTGEIELTDFAISNSQYPCTMKAQYTGAGNGGTIVLTAQVTYGKRKFSLSAALQQKKIGTIEGVYPSGANGIELSALIEQSKGSSNIGLAGNEETVILVSKDTTMDFAKPELTFNGNNKQTIFIVVKPGYQLSLASTYSRAHDKARDIFILVQPGATLRIMPTEGTEETVMNCFIYAPEGQVVVNSDVSMRGEMKLGTLINPGVETDDGTEIPPFNITYGNKKPVKPEYDWTSPDFGGASGDKYGWGIMKYQVN